MTPSRRFAVAAALAIVAACGGSGGSSGSTSPTPAPTPGINACSAIAAASTGSSAGFSPYIVNGTECPATSSAVVSLTLRNSNGENIGQCSGTIIGSRSVLTAAHCLAGVTSVRMFAGDATQLTISQSVAGYPGYKESDPNALDVGVVSFASNIGRTPIPVLASRDARQGETAVIAGWGKDQNQVAATLRAGTAVITAVDSVLIHTTFSTTASSVCQGDSGGPLLLQESGTWAIAGIVSANQTTACAFGENFYANVRNSAISAFIAANAPDAARK